MDAQGSPLSITVSGGSPERFTEMPMSSEDGGVTWGRGYPIRGEGSIQPSSAQSNESDAHPLERIKRRLDLYIAALAVVSDGPNVEQVEPVGTVAVPIPLMQALAEAVQAYYPDEPRVRTYK